MYPTIDTYNMTAGAYIMVCYVNDVTGGMFMHLTIAAVLLVITMGSYFAQKRLTGYGDLPAAFMLGSFSTLIFTILLRILDCPHNSLIDDLTLGIMIAATFTAFLWVSFSRE